MSLFVRCQCPSENKCNERRTDFAIIIWPNSGWDDTRDCGPCPGTEANCHIACEGEAGKGPNEVCGTTLGNGRPSAENQTEGVWTSG